MIARTYGSTASGWELRSDRANARTRASLDQVFGLVIVAAQQEGMPFQRR